MGARSLLRVVVFSACAEVVRCGITAPSRPERILRVCGGSSRLLWGVMRATVYSPRVRR